MTDDSRIVKFTYEGNIKRLLTILSLD